MCVSNLAVGTCTKKCRGCLLKFHMHDWTRLCVCAGQVLAKRLEIEPLRLDFLEDRLVNARHIVRAIHRGNIACNKAYGDYEYRQPKKAKASRAEAGLQSRHSVRDAEMVSFCQAAVSPSHEDMINQHTAGQLSQDRSMILYWRCCAGNRAGLHGPGGVSCLKYLQSTFTRWTTSRGSCSALKRQACQEEEA